MEKIRFHLDEQVDRAIGEALIRRGIDVTTTPEAGLLGAVDQEQLAFAISQQRVIFTRDDDFFSISSTRYRTLRSCLLSPKQSVNWRNCARIDFDLGGA